MGYAVLIIEDEAVLAKKIAKFLQNRGLDVRITDNGAEGLDNLTAFQPDAVLLDFNLPGSLNGLQVLERIRSIDPGIKVIMITGHGNVRVAVDAMKAGAYEYLSKPIVLSELKLLLDRAITQRRTEEQLSYFQEKQASESDTDLIIGESESIRQVKNQIARITRAGQQLVDGPPPSVLITGETGTGKELVARALHFAGPRQKQPFVELNAATIPSHLVESELFGYEKGAFTDARQRKLGLVETADGGTLFLDEIGELDLSVQAKLLRLLEDRKVRRIGSLRDVGIDLQIITATNRSLESMVVAERFRQDLLFRLNTLTIHVPPLRERGEDILLLVNHFLDIFGRKYARPVLTLPTQVGQVLLDYDWPGNVRELRNRVEQAVLLCDGTELQQAHFSLPERAQATAPGQKSGSASNNVDPSAQNEMAPGTTLQEMEKRLIQQTLDDLDGNVSKAARRLGIRRDRLRYRLEKYQLKRK